MGPLYRIRVFPLGSRLLQIKWPEKRPQQKQSNPESKERGKMNKRASSFCFLCSKLRRHNLAMASSNSEPSRSEEKSEIDSDKPSTSSQEKEQCKACTIDRSPSEMVSHYSKNKEETHRFCSTCLKYLLYLDGYPATCIFCGEFLKDEDYWQVLSPSFKALVSMLKEEKSIPVKERVYCANQHCSALHSKAEARLPEEELAKLDYDASGLAECKKCKQHFCLNCRVPWHDFMSCDDYMKSVLSMEREVDDKKLFLLAEKKFWVRCNECKRIIDHDGGCENIHCRCGNKFKNTNRKDY